MAKTRKNSAAVLLGKRSVKAHGEGVTRETLRYCVTRGNGALG
jgi:hypothetical protein